MVQDRAILTMADWQEVIWFIELCHIQWHWMTTNPDKRACHCKALNISEVIQDRQTATTYCTANTKHYMAICSLCIKLCHCARDVWRSIRPFINSAFLNSFIVCIWYEVNCNGQTLNVSNYFCCRIPPEGLLHVAMKTDYKYINKHADDKLKI